MPDHCEKCEKGRAIIKRLWGENHGVNLPLYFVVATAHNVTPQQFEAIAREAKKKHDEHFKC